MKSIIEKIKKCFKKNKPLSIFLFFSFLIFLIPFCNAVTYVNSCINDTHLLKTASVYINEEIVTYNQTIYCEFGCDYNRLECKEPYNPNEAQINTSLILYFTLFFISLGSLILGLYYGKVMLCFFSTILFLILSFQSINLDIIFNNTKFQGLTWIFIYLNWLFTIISFFGTLIGAVLILKDSGKND